MKFAKEIFKKRATSDWVCREKHAAMYPEGGGCWGGVQNTVEFSI